MSGLMSRYRKKTVCLGDGMQLMATGFLLYIFSTAAIGAYAVVRDNVSSIIQIKVFVQVFQMSVECFKVEKDNVCNALGTNRRARDT